MQREGKVGGESDPSVDFGRTSEHPDVTLGATQEKVYWKWQRSLEEK